MKLFLTAFLIIIAVCLYFGFTDEEPLGDFIAAGFFSVILICVLVYNKMKRGGWLSDRANSIALPLAAWVFDHKVAVALAIMYCLFLFVVWAIVRVGAKADVE